MQDCCLTCKNLEYRKNYVYPYRCLKHKAERFSEKEFERLDEKPVGAGQFLSGNVFADSASIGSTFYSESQIIYDVEQETILKVAEQGPCVIIGRCASSILRGKKNVLSVFIYADEADRVARIASRNRLDEPQARARMRKTDRMRRRYFDFYADTQWGDPESYDVMLSSSYYGVDGCVEMICKSLQMKGNSHE